MVWSSQPMRILAVTGTPSGAQAATTARATDSSSGQSRSSAEPPFLETTLFTGTAEVEVDEVGLHPIDHRAGGLGQAGGVRAEELHADGPLDCRIEIQHLPRALVAMQDALGGHEFRRQDIRAHFLAELAEDGVCHPCHGGEKKGGKSACTWGCGHRPESTTESARQPGQSKRRPQSATLGRGNYFQNP